MAASLPLQLTWELAQTKWAQAINPVLGVPMNAGIQVNNIVLVANTPKVINTNLSRMQQGWIIVDQNAPASVYRTQPFNSSTLTLEASANVTISVWMY